MRLEKEAKATALVQREKAARLACEGKGDPLFQPSASQRKKAALNAENDTELSKVLHAVSYMRNPGGVVMVMPSPGSTYEDDYHYPEAKYQGTIMSPVKRRPDCAVSGNPRGNLIHFVEVMEVRTSPLAVGRREPPLIRVHMPEIKKVHYFSLRCIRGPTKVPEFEDSSAFEEAAKETWTRLPSGGYKWSKAAKPTTAWMA